MTPQELATSVVATLISMGSVVGGVAPLELAANVMATLSILLAGRNNIHTWWTGIVGCALFAWLFVQAKLYADVTLQAFFILSSVVGWWRWRGHVDAAPAPVTRASSRVVTTAAVVGAVAAVSYGGLLYHFTDAYAPYPDSAVLSFSVVGQWLLMQRRVESWPFWVLVNIIAVPLYYSRDLYLTSALYAVYLVNALVSWRHWWKLAQADDALPAAATA
ncbi:nicotinamide riboside transporter PnuC [Ideonella sp. DXS29W]|uniref:Nicotinamide riboside transporter PnuC n=1 Tax=Ideonella lacteola TaxID=2984193 RepID=A0ABU9BHY7_9BURK